MLEQFEDPRDGGFFFTSHDHEALVVRPKSGHDGATASGNGMAALHLQRLGHLIGEPRYLQAAERTMALFAGEVRRVPHGFATLVAAMAETASPPAVVVLTGPSRCARAMARRARRAAICLACLCCNCRHPTATCRRRWPSHSRRNPGRGCVAARNAWRRSTTCGRSPARLTQPYENGPQRALRAGIEAPANHCATRSRRNTALSSLSTGSTFTCSSPASLATPVPARGQAKPSRPPACARLPSTPAHRGSCPGGAGCPAGTTASRRRSARARRG